jgi:acyl-CoA synthetase (AMP-forming)/AMP-acid ligase II
VVLDDAQVIMDTCQDAAELTSLHNLALGAEALNPATLANAQRMAPNAAIYNCYGRAYMSRCLTCGRLSSCIAPALLHFTAQTQSELLWHNFPGPTEASVMVATFRCDQYSGIGSVPIGRPIHNTRLYVLDPRSLRPLPVGAPGELFASGVGVARGYAGQPQLTAERFLPNPFKQPDDSPSYDRMYRTGDVVAWLPDGNLRWGLKRHSSHAETAFSL